jgi:hypothetical protein
VNTYTVTVTLRTPFNPSKWDWTELLASEEGEEIIAVDVEKKEGQ